MLNSTENKSKGNYYHVTEIIETKKGYPENDWYTGYDRDGRDHYHTTTKNTLL